MFLENRDSGPDANRTAWGDRTNSCAPDSFRNSETSVHSLISGLLGDGGPDAK